MRATKKRTPTFLDEARGRKRARIRSSSSHVFTIPESMNLRVFLRNFILCVFQQVWSFLSIAIIPERDSLQPSKNETKKDQIILAPGRSHFGRFLGFSDFSKGSPLWNNDNKSCLNVIKFWEVSRNQKTNKFWKLPLSISCRTQKSARSSYLGPRWSGLFVKNIRWTPY